MVPRLMLLSAVILWGWSFVATKILITYVSPLEALGLRYIIGIPVLVAIVAVRRQTLKVERRHIKLVALASLIITAHFLIQITGLQTTSATNTGWLISVTPLTIAVLSFLILKERITKAALVGIGVATAGILLLMSRGQFTELDWLSSTGDWLVVASAQTWAIYTVATRDLSRAYKPLPVTFNILWPSAAVVVSLMLATSDLRYLWHLPATAWWAAIFLGVFTMAVAHWFWQAGVAYLGAARAGYFLYLEPLATTSLAVPYLGEPFGWATAAGGAMVLAGVFIAERRFGERKAK